MTAEEKLRAMSSAAYEKVRRYENNAAFQGMGLVYTSLYLPVNVTHSLATTVPDAEHGASPSSCPLCSFTLYVHPACDTF